MNISNSTLHIYSPYSKNSRETSKEPVEKDIDLTPEEVKMKASQALIDKNRKI